MKTLARERDQDELLRRLEAVGPDSLARWGRMSSHQMMCHLGDSFLMMLGERKVNDASGVLQRTIVKWAALNAPARWPRGIMTLPEVDQYIAGTRPDEFARDRARASTLMHRARAESARCHLRRHPIFGPLSESAWLRWAYLHTDHHLRQFGA